LGRNRIGWKHHSVGNVAFGFWRIMGSGIRNLCFGRNSHHRENLGGSTAKSSVGVKFKAQSSKLKGESLKFEIQNSLLKNRKS
jgi:hypothetical protein